MFAILEFKNTHVIYWDDFEPAACTKANLSEKIEEGEATLLDHNSLTIAKQAAKYGKNCPFVAVFDWYSMLLFDFSDEWYVSRKQLVGGTLFQGGMEDRM